MFDFKVEGIESIQSDYDEFNLKVNRATGYGLKSLASELAPALQRHIREDVYEAYSPKRYQRRYNHPQYGRSLYSEKNMSWNLVNRSGGHSSVEFSYEPDGYNSHYPNARYYPDGDTIIDVLQNDRGYLWRGMDGIGKERRFWDSFVDEVVSEGDKWFVQGFNEYDHENLRAVADGALVREASDYRLDPTYEVKRS